MSRLNDLLQSFSSADLTRMCKRVGGSGLSQMYSGDRVRYVAALLSRPDRVGDAITTVGKSGEDMLRAVAKEGGVVKRAELVRLFPGQNAVIDQLIDEFLLFQNLSLQQKAGWDVLCLPQEFLAFLERDPKDLETLGACLLAQPSSYHSGLASVYSLQRQANSVAYYSLQVKEILKNPAQLKSVVSQLNEQEKSVLETALDHGGLIEQQDIPSLWDRSLSFDSYYRGKDDSPVVNLYRFGLLFPNALYRPSHLILPSDVMAILRPVSAEKKRMSVAVDVPAHLRTYGLRFVEDLRLLSAALASEALRTTQKGVPEKRGLEQLLSAVGVNEINYGYFLWVVGLPRGAESNDPTERMKGFIQRWVADGRYQESIAQRINGRYRDPRLSNQRKLLLNVLRDLPLGAWVTHGDFVSAVETPEWRRASLRESNDSFGYNPWAGTSSRATLETMAVECLVWLGLVEIGVKGGTGEEGVFSHIRLTPWGEFFTKNKPGPFPGLAAPVEEDRFTVLPHLEITAPPGLKPSLLAKLFGVAELSGPHTFTLSKESIAKAMDAGLSPANMVDFLRDNSKTGVPDSVLRLLGDLGKKHGQVKVGCASTYLTVEDPHVAREILASKAFQRMAPKAVGERAVIFREPNPQKVLGILKKMGHFPVMEEDGRFSGEGNTLAELDRLFNKAVGRFRQ